MVTLKDLTPVTHFKKPHLPPQRAHDFPRIPSQVLNQMFTYIGEAVRVISHSSHQIERSPFCVTMTSRNESNDVGNFMII